jgi:hypothetical protein
VFFFFFISSLPPDNWPSRLKTQTIVQWQNQLTISLPLSSSDGLCCGPEAGAGEEISEHGADVMLLLRVAKVGVNR